RAGPPLAARERFEPGAAHISDRTFASPQHDWVIPERRTCARHAGRTLQLAARPARSTIAIIEDDPFVVRTGIRAPLGARPLPERQPLAGMALANALCCAHRREHRRPHGHIRKVALTGRRTRHRANAAS